MRSKEISISNLINVSSSRRDFIFNNVKMLGAVALGSYTIGLINACSNDSNPTSPSSNNNVEISIDISQIANSALQTIGGTIALSGNDLDSKGILVIRKNETEIVALSRKCTHQGCTVPNYSNSISTCPCHGSQYNTSGSVVKGPATNSLRNYSAVLNGNIISVTA